MRVFTDTERHYVNMSITIILVASFDFGIDFIIDDLV